MRSQCNRKSCHNKEIDRHNKLEFQISQLIYDFMKSVKVMSKNCMNHTLGETLTRKSRNRPIITAPASDTPKKPQKRMITKGTRQYTLAPVAT